MRATSLLRTVVAWAWRLPLCALAYLAGTMAAGAVVSTLGLPLPEIPEQANAETMGLVLALANVVLALGVAPLARGMKTTYPVRALILALLCYVCLGVNTPIEAAIFTKLGGMSTMVLFSLLPCLLFGAVTALLFKHPGRAEPFRVSARRFFSGRNPGQWAWRLVAAAVVFPAIYLSFGMMVAPVVAGYYRQEQFGLTLPSGGAIVLVQLLRGSLFLLAALPVLIAWPGSRLRLTVTLGLALYVLVGLFSMMQSYWLAPALQIAHNLEIFADSMVHALVLTLLLVPAGPARSEAPAATPSLPVPCA
ncbi:MAG: hypothetical protein JW741_07885 [Sedimentisphaerales bacterium]|nr:hypothetical protein [Sedimentisphaerales bacterium]